MRSTNKQKAVRVYRCQIPSPGRPTVASWHLQSATGASVSWRVFAVDQVSDVAVAFTPAPAVAATVRIAGTNRPVLTLTHAK